MNVNIVARPDHSLNMFEQLLKCKSDEDIIKLYTFYALRKGSIANKLFPKLKVAPEQAVTLDSFTVITRLSNMLLKKFGANPRKNEIRIFKYLAPKNKIAACELLHYWPFYCADMIRKVRQEKYIKTVAEYYEAEPDFVNYIYGEEYTKYGIKNDTKINLMIDQNLCFEFEDNFIVASEFTKKSYQSKYPNKNYYVCKYGPAGYTLDKSTLLTLKKNTNKTKLVFVGQICVEKGVHYLIEAIKDLDVTLDLIGPIRSGQESIFNDLIRNSQNINTLGAMRHSQVLTCLTRYDLFCLPSLADNYSLAVVEALSKGKPVIVTENCGNAEDVIKLNLGMVAKVKNAESLKECILNFNEYFDYEKFQYGLTLFFSNENQQAYPNSVLQAYKKIIGNNK